MSDDDELSISFASSIEHIKNEYLKNSNLYSDLDQLEKSVDAEFDEYIQRARSFPIKSSQQQAATTSTTSIEQMKQNIDTWQRYLNNKSHNRPTSPGEYFGARSLPLDSVGNVWHKKPVVNKDTDKQSQSTNNNKEKTEMEKLLDTRFKSLPSSIRLFPKPYTHQKKQQKESPAASTSSSHGVRSFTSSEGNTSDEQPSYTIEPSSPLHFLCEISTAAIYAKIIHLKITNLLANASRHYSLYSLKNLIEFDDDIQEGVIHDTVQVNIKVKSSAIRSYQRHNEELDPLTDKILILIDGEQVNELVVNIDFISLEDDDDDQPCHQERPKCRFCALEQGYPLLHCL